MTSPDSPHVLCPHDKVHAREDHPDIRNKPTVWRSLEYSAKNCNCLFFTRLHYSINIKMLLYKYIAKYKGM